MSPWAKGKRHESWASNPNIAVYIFSVLFVAWLVFQVWSRLPGGPPPPTGLDPMVMAALGVAISAKSVEKKQHEEHLERRVAEAENRAAAAESRQDASDERQDALENVAREVHPDVVAEHSPPLSEGGNDGSKQ